ncbi:hypothetical protein EVA_01863 [gut metagenome]|uniref:Uncharacterized protein n=1 Tax=gut metagenome TaxID=749906 RepID=J9GQG1_9ZZZZ
MRSHTATSRQDTFSFSHTSEVFRRSFDTYHYNLVTVSMPLHRIFSEEYDLTASRTRASRQTTSQFLSLSQSLLVEDRVEEFVELVRFATQDRSLFVDHALAYEIHSDLHHGSTGTLTVTSLEEPEFTFLYGKFHILHIAVVLFELCLECIELSVDLRHRLFHRRIFALTFFFRDTLERSPAAATFECDLLRSADTRNHVFTLSVNEPFTVEEVFTCSCVTAEANTCSRSVTHVTEYHGHHGNGSTPFSRNTFHLTVEDSTFVHPAVEYGADGTPELFHRIGWESLARLSEDCFLEENDQLLEVFHFEFVVQLHALFFLHLFDDGFEWVNVFLVHRLHAQYHVTVHLYETAVSIVCETRVVGLLSQTFYYLVVQTEVEDGVHHTRHRSASTRTYRKQEWVFYITELRSHQVFYLVESADHVSLQHFNDFSLTNGIVIVTCICGYRKSGRNGNTDEIHFGQVCTFATQFITHIGAAFSLTGAERINSFLVCHN